MQGLTLERRPVHGFWTDLLKKSSNPKKSKIGCLRTIFPSRLSQCLILMVFLLEIIGLGLLEMTLIESLTLERNSFTHKFMH